MPTVEVSGEVRTETDRLVGFSRYGRLGGAPVLMHYGTPGTRNLGPMMRQAVERHDVDLLVLDRPGYGISTRRPGRGIADVVEDAALVADSCGWKSFAVWGGSGGGPLALACAALLGDRVERCASVVGPAPFEAEGLNWMEGMSPGNVEEFTLARQGERAYRPLSVATEGRRSLHASHVVVRAERRYSSTIGRNSCGVLPWRITPSHPSAS